VGHRYSLHFSFRRKSLSLFLLSSMCVGLLFISCYEYKKVEIESYQTSITTALDWMFDKKEADTTIIKISGNTKNGKFLEIILLPEDLFDPAKYTSNIGAHEKVFEPYSCSKTKYDSRIGNIDADSLIRFRFTLKDVYSKRMGFCWELRFSNRIIQSVLIADTRKGLPPRDISIVSNIETNPQFKITSDAMRVSISKQFLLLSAVGALAEGVDEKASAQAMVPKLVHLALLGTYLRDASAQSLNNVWGNM